MASSSSLLLFMATVAIFGLMVAPPCTADNALSSPNSLLRGGALTTGSYTLIMQSDCNLVLYDKGNVVWATNTHERGSDCRLTLQNNGNLVIYDQSNHLIWETGRSGRDDHYVLVLQQDRNVVVYGPVVWAANTGPANGITVGPHNATASVDAAATQVIESIVARPMLNK